MFQASNQLSKVEVHAAHLEKIADDMAAAGIGNDPVRGHVVTARQMAADLRANAARGTLPSAFNHLYAMSDVAGVHASGKGKTSAAEIEAALATVPGFNANLRRAVISAMVAKGVVGDDVDKISAAASRQKTIASVMASNPAAQSGLKLVLAQARRLGFEIKENEPISLVEMDKALAGKDIDARLALKVSLKRYGLL